MTRLNLLLLALTMLAAMGVVRAQYDARRAYAALDAARQHAEQLQLDHDRLQVEVRALSVPGRIEAIARDSLGFVPITASRIDFVSAASAAGAVGGPALAASIPTR